MYKKEPKRNRAKTLISLTLNGYSRSVEKTGIRGLCFCPEVACFIYFFTNYVTVDRAKRPGDTGDG